MGLKNDLIKVASSNLVVLLASVLNGFVLPSILTIQGYADFRTYTLYVTFVGFLHFGFIDGINVKYGGLSLKDVDYSEFKRYHSFFWAQQFFISILVLIVGIFFQNRMIVFVALAIIPINLQSFFLFFYQATGEFLQYSKSTIIVPACNLIFTFTLLLLGVKEYYWFVFSSIISYVISIILLELNFYKRLKNDSVKFDFSRGLQYLKVKNMITEFNNNRSIFISGFYIMLGTVFFNFFFNTGQWLVKFFFSSEKFAIYSMAISLIGFIVIFISAINKTFYPYLHRNNSQDNIIILKNMLYIISSLSLSIYFLIEKFIEVFIPKYTMALPITAILFLSIPAVFVVKSIYANMYKVNKIEKLFLFDTVKFLIIGVIISVVLFFLNRNIISIAIASTVSVYIWAIFPTGMKINIKNRLIEVLYILLITFGFLIIYNYKLNFISSFIIVLLYSSVINLIFYREIIFLLTKIKR